LPWAMDRNEQQSFRQAVRDGGNPDSIGHRRISAVGVG
jgi:hypothetical protein